MPHRTYRDGSPRARTLDDERYGSETGRGGRSKFSPRGNDQDWGEDRERSGRDGQRETRRPYGRGSSDRDPPENFAGDMEDFGGSRAAQFGFRNYYGSGDHVTRPYGLHGRERDQYFASDDDRDWDVGQIVRGRSSERGHDPTPQSLRRPRRRGRAEE